MTPAQAIARYGNPMINQSTFEKKWMISFDINDEINKANPVIPNRIYINKEFAQVADNWLNALMEANVLNEIKTWDGCFNVRYQRGSRTILSMHSFGIAIDINASHNPLGLTREQCIAKGLTPFSEKFITISERWLTCGARFKSRPDRMHFELRNI